MFNTAELLIDQLGLTPGIGDDDPGLHLVLNTFVEDVRDLGDHVEVVARDVRTGTTRTFWAGTAVLAGGSIESPKLLRRSAAFAGLPDGAKELVGRGLTDHPTTNEIATLVTGIDDVAIPRLSNIKIIFYSKGERDGGQVRYPFNVEMNINHEFWHLRDDDPTALQGPGFGPSRLDIKFSFANCLDDGNEIHVDTQTYVPDVDFHNLSWADHVTKDRLPLIAGWAKNNDELWAVLNDITHQIFSRFHRDGVPARPDGEVWYGQGGKGFGWGTVHHAAGSLRMPARPGIDQPFGGSVVDDDLRVAGTQNLRLRHVRHADDLGRQPRPHPRGIGSAAVGTPGLSVAVLVAGNVHPRRMVTGEVPGSSVASSTRELLSNSLPFGRVSGNSIGQHLEARST